MTTIIKCIDGQFEIRNERLIRLRFNSLFKENYSLNELNLIPLNLRLEGIIYIINFFEKPEIDKYEDELNYILKKLRDYNNK